MCTHTHTKRESGPYMQTAREKKQPKQDKTAAFATLRCMQYGETS